MNIDVGHNFYWMECISETVCLARQYIFSYLFLKLFTGVLLALLVSARIYDFSRTVQDIVKVVRIGEGTIKKRFSLLIFL